VKFFCINAATFPSVIVRNGYDCDVPDQSSLSAMSVTTNDPDYGGESPILGSGSQKAPTVMGAPSYASGISHVKWNRRHFHAETSDE